MGNGNEENCQINVVLMENFHHFQTLSGSHKVGRLAVDMAALREFGASIDCCDKYISLNFPKYIFRVSGSWMNVKNMNSIKH